MANPIMTQTLPTVIGMGVVSRTTETMFGKGGGSSRRTKHGRKKTVVVGVASTKAKAEALVARKKKLLKRYSQSTAGFRTKKVTGGYLVTYTG